ncbi:UDP-N-acetylmuramate dehydrogenase [Acetitomaculum ruminis DSM 5522]|uniref:UDP-N-acetylenolpyruvoylglucosamine reductase n=1 Tax=Acetitomaculum ruminis DSM 5522 TaxID=1120918 RepID=A0A1I0XAD9_9FIRM|nr:UDP-N-acetylmuramate dehydrogenase [Acetitomaculum ruminis]SFA98039.1 UDP-N-acetylmuramate dehydrogenase [Acetitomaculum ruminis DSM 5522]
MDNGIFSKLKEINGNDYVFKDELMSKHTTFKTGGAAKYFVTPDSVEKIVDTIEFCKENKIDFFVMGNGSNLLFSDEGFDGIVIQIFDKLKNIDIKDGKISVDAGCLLASMSKKAAKDGYTGLEFCSGIPGTVGGAVAMNAGAYGGEMKNVVEEVILYTDKGIKTYKCDEMDFGYRKSIVTKNDYIVLGAKINIEKGNIEDINSRMEELKRLRKEKQPLEYPSAGSTFKRPEGYFAGKLIMDAGLSGYQIGGAKVSPKHCGFVINANKATSKDVYELIKFVQKTVKEKFGVTLETEIKLIGNF